MSTVLELVRRSVINQYAGLTPTLYPGELATAPTPFASIDAMWLVSQTMATNRTPAISGETYFFFAPLEGLSLQTHAGDRSLSRSATPPSLTGRVGGSHNPVVMSRSLKSTIVILIRFHSYQHWPADTSH